MGVVQHLPLGGGGPDGLNIKRKEYSESILRLTFKWGSKNGSSLGVF